MSAKAHACHLDLCPGMSAKEACRARGSQITLRNSRCLFGKCVYEGVIGQCIRRLYADVKAVLGYSTWTWCCSSAGDSRCAPLTRSLLMISLPGGLLALICSYKQGLLMQMSCGPDSKNSVIVGSLCCRLCWGWVSRHHATDTVTLSNSVKGSYHPERTAGRVWGGGGGGFVRAVLPSKCSLHSVHPPGQS